MSTDLGRLASAVKARRLALYPSRVAAAKAAGISKDTWRRVEDGEIVRDGTYMKIDAALQWAPGSCSGIIKGHSAMPVQDVEGEPGAVTSVVHPEALDQDVRDIVQLASIATTKGLTAEEIRALSNRVVQDLKELGVI